jgi:hypothetical protein
VLWSFPICLFQEAELTGFITDYLQKAYIPVVNGEASPRIRIHFTKGGFHLCGPKDLGVDDQCLNIEANVVLMSSWRQKPISSFGL